MSERSDPTASGRAFDRRSGHSRQTDAFVRRVHAGFRGAALATLLFHALSTPAASSLQPAQALPGRDESPLGQVLASLYRRGEACVVQVIASRPVGPCASAAEGWGRSQDSGPVRVSLTSTGIVIDSEGRVLACADGAQPGDSLIIRDAGGREHHAEFVSQDAAAGVALLRVSESRGLAPCFGAEAVEPMEEGDWLLVQAFPDGDEAQELRLGRMHRLQTATGPSERVFRVGLSGSHGTCGGAIFDGYGRLRGMVVNVGVREESDAFVGGCPEPLAYLIEGSHVNALTRSAVLALYEKMREAAGHREGFLGVQVVVADSASVPVGSPLAVSTGPVSVARVMRGSPADVAGLREGDEIASFDGLPVGRVEHVTARIARLEPGATVRLGILRQGAPLVLRATVGDRSSLQWFERQHRLNQSLHWHLRDQMSKQERYLAKLERLEERYR